MNATLQPQRWPLIALLAVFFLALMAALAPGLSELDLSGIGGDERTPRVRPRRGKAARDKGADRELVAGDGHEPGSNPAARRRGR